MIYELCLATLFIVWVIDCIICFFVGVFYANRKEIPAKAYFIVLSCIALTTIVNYIMI